MAIYNFGMRGKEHLEHLLGDNPLSYKKAQAFKKIIDWATDYGLDIVEVYNELRFLLDVNRDKESTKPNLYLLTSNVSDSCEPRTAVILAMNEIEARLNAAIECFEDSFLDNSSCVEVNTSTCSVVTYT